MGKYTSSAQDAEVRDQWTHNFQDTTGRFAVDQLLRECGFKIFSRRSGEQVFWEKDGILYSHREALRHVCPRKVEKAEELEEWYKRGMFR